MKKLNYKIFYYIIKEMMNNNAITENALAKNLEVSERTIRRYIKILKDRKVIFLEGYGEKRIWIVNDKFFKDNLLK